MKLKFFLRILGILAFVAATFPYLPLEHWSVRMFDFPQLQLALLTLFAFLLYFVKFDFNSWRDYLLVSILGICFAVQAYKVVPYTPLGPYQLEDGLADTPSTISLYNANVLQKNKEYHLVIEDIKAHDPDIVVLLETNSRWEQAVSPKLANTYPYSSKAPLNNTYGMLLYSKLALVDPRVQYLVEDTIPSIHTGVINRVKDTFQLIAIHPTPPVPTQSDTSVDRDAEMMMVAQMARKSTYPVLIMGDFNDVAWSESTELFQHVSEMLDPRKGRGLYNTFNAHNWILRWPLDHIFCTAHFRLLDIKKGQKTGSDHFPYYVKLSYEPEKAEEQAPKPPSEELISKAFEQIRQERTEPQQ